MIPFDMSAHIILLAISDFLVTIRIKEGLSPNMEYFCQAWMRDSNMVLYIILLSPFSAVCGFRV